MATVEDLQRHLEEHPDDHASRWRLAKKLYMKCEYRQALDCLLILKAEWIQKQNVLRYLAATYYRLGQYDEATEELESAIALWPDEVPLHEQLARVHEVAERREDAARVWRDVQAIAPDHPFASRSIERLSRPRQDTPQDDLRLHESDSGIDMSPAVTCPECGAQNSVEFDRCWQCHGELNLTPTPSPFEFEGQPPKSARSKMVVHGLLSVAVLAASVYFTIQYVLPALTGAPPARAAENVRQAMLYGLAEGRAVMGFTLLLVWPLALWVAVRLFNVRLLRAGQPWTFGLFMAGLAYLASWTPVLWLPAALGVVLILGALFTKYIFYLPWGRGLAVGTLHALVAGAVGAGAFVLIAGPEPFTETAAITRLENMSDPANGSSREHEGTTRLDLPHRFRSSGSDWLDSLTSTVAFEINSQVTDPQLVVEYRDETGLVQMVDVTQPTVRLVTKVKPGRDYRLIVSGKKGVTVRVRPLSALGVEFDT